MTTSPRTIIEHCLAAIMAKDLDQVLSLLADDAVVIDPHYPVPRMQGKAAIADGLRWVFGTMQQLGFSISNYFEAGDGRRAAVEIATTHVLRAGMRLRFPQVFVFETWDGKITRLQVYPPYGPPGIGALVLALVRLKRKLLARGQPRG
jgi:ketosteroid isomerase-like protein